MRRIICFLWLLSAFLTMTAQEYPKAILPGDYPDPTIVRDGEDYYMTHSPFYYMPGFLIWHSRNLTDWEPIARVVPEYSGSAMAPDLIKHNGRFYLYYPAAGTNWVVWADDIRGPWSKPIDLKINGIDPGHVVGEDGKRYLFVSDGNRAMPMAQLSDDGLSIVGRKKPVYEGWEFPKEWETEGLWLESPKLVKRGDYFYLTTAEGGTAGPATSHMVVSARSKSVSGPWENSPYNPIVHTYSADEEWWSKGHGTLIDDVNGNWWFVYHAYAKGYHTLGRSTLIEPVVWTEDGWFHAASEATSLKTECQVANGMELSDDFKGPELGLQWTFWKEYAPHALNFKSGALCMEGKGETPANARLLLTTATDRSYETQVEINVGKGNTAGLILYYNEKAYAGIVSDGKVFTVYTDAEKSVNLPNDLGKRFMAKIRNNENSMRIAVSKDGKEWITLVDNLGVSQMHHNNYGGFYALRIGLLSAGKGKAGFRHFRYNGMDLRAKDMEDGSLSKRKNPAFAGYYADPEVLYSQKTQRYYIYPTCDGIVGWGSTRFRAFSSNDLVHWKDEGVILDLEDVSWAKKNAWAPAIIEKKQTDGSYKYYYYFTAEGKIGVAVSDSPTGPFVDSGQPLISERPEGMTRGANIDPDVFCDPVSGKTYLYWGNYFMAVCELNDDMVSVKPNTTCVLIDDDTYYSEGTYVFYRKGYYYFMWSKNDTRSPDYQVRYVRSKSPTGPIDASQGKTILCKRPGKGIFATGHHSILQLPEKDEWRVVYHRFSYPDAINMGRNAGYHREVCIDEMEFDTDGNIKQVEPTL